MLPGTPPPALATKQSRRPKSLPTASIVFSIASASVASHWYALHRMLKRFESSSALASWFLRPMMATSPPASAIASAVAQPICCSVRSS